MRQRFRTDREIDLLVTPQHSNRQIITNLGGLNQAQELPRVTDLLLGRLNHQVSAPEAGPISWAIRNHPLHQRPIPLRQLQKRIGVCVVIAGQAGI